MSLKGARKARILVLEDEHIMLEVLCDALQIAGHEAHGANRPEQAIEMSRKFTFDLVISDIRMAGPVDGLGAVAAIKKAQPGIRVIMITGYASDDCPRRAIELQVDDYVYKPFRVADLLKVVQRTLNRGRSLLAPLVGLRKFLSAMLLEQNSARRMADLIGLVEQEKHRVLKGYFVALRSKSMSKSAALETWDQLELLERSSAQLEREADEGAVKYIGQAYRRIFERIGYYEKTGHVASAPARQSDQVSRAGFGMVVEKIQAGQVTLEEFVQLLCVRQEPASRSDLSGSLQELYLQLTGERSTQC
ncbi:MAG: response regulator [Candidatus Eremiobacteraeota bacterium]|nr:response regulator [Candidatus Eremiobacteraeota bacterium]MCW5869087.1 response regulator [Candidatus Eremiobacteraeota bacterium]